MALALIGVVVVFGSRILTNAAKGYVGALGADEVVQKAQIALQRMTIEFSAIDATSTRSGTSTSINYTGSGSIGQHAIQLSGTTLLYTQGGQSYVLTDDVAPGGLAFMYYPGYSGSDAGSFSNATKLIGIRLTMHNSAWPTGLTKEFETRVAIKNF